MDKKNEVEEINKEQPKSSWHDPEKITAYSTVVYVIVSIFMWCSLQKQIEQTSQTLKVMDKSNQLQDSNLVLQRNFVKTQTEYLAKSSRPMVYIDSVRFAYKSDSNEVSVLLLYAIKNIGYQPAKKMSVRAIYNKEAVKIFLDTLREYTGVISSLYPNQVRFAQHGEGYIPLKRIIEQPYLHFLLEYYDMQNSVYRSSQIFLLKYDRSKVSTEPLEQFVIWEDYE